MDEALRQRIRAAHASVQSQQEWAGKVTECVLPHADQQARDKARRNRRHRGYIADTELALLAEWDLQRVPFAEMARRLGVQTSTAIRHVRSIRLERKEDRKRQAEEELIRLDWVEEVAVDRFCASMRPEKMERIKQDVVEAAKAGGISGAMQTVEKVFQKTTRTGEGTWLSLVMQCIAERCRILGHYAATKNESKLSGSVALLPMGKMPSREEIQQKIENRVREIAERLLTAQPN